VRGGRRRDDLLELLGHFASDDDLDFAPDLPDRLQRREHAMRRFVEHDCALRCADFFEGGLSSLFVRQESQEREFV